MTINGADARSERVLVLVPPGPDATLVESVLGQAGLALHRCGDVGEFAEAWRAGAGAALLTDEQLRPDVMPRLVDLVARQPPWSDFPLLLFFGSNAESPATALRMLDMLQPLGNVTILERPVRLMTLVSAARSALHARRRQYEVRDLLVQLETAVRRRDAFLARLAHELRNPLGTIRNAAHILEQGDPDEEARARQRTVIGRQTSHLARLIDDLLDASRVTSGEIQLQRQAVDLREVVRRVLGALDTAVRAQRLQVTFDAAPEPLAVEGDPRRLEQVADNLIRNAVTYTPEGGRVRVTLRREGDRAVLRVADNGAGFSAEELPRVFSLFGESDHLLDRPRPQPKL